MTLFTSESFLKGSYIIATAAMNEKKLPGVLSPLNTT